MDPHRMIVEKITFSILSIDDDVVEIGAFGYSKGMSMRGRGLISKSELLKKIPIFREFPLLCPVSVISAGIWNDNGIGIKAEHLGIAIEKIDHSGRMMLRLNLYEEDFEYGDRGYGCGGRLDYHINHANFSEFIDGLASLVTGDLQSFEFSSFADW